MTCSLMRRNLNKYNNIQINFRGVVDCMGSYKQQL